MQRGFKLVRVDLRFENPGKVKLKEDSNLHVCKDSEYKR